MRAALIVALAVAAPAAARVDTYRGFTLDMTQVPSADRDTMLAAAHRQVDIVLGVGLGERTLAVFRGYPVHVVTGGAGESHFGRDGVKMSLSGRVDDRPILLHEYMHVYQARILPGGGGNADLQRFFVAAHRVGYPPRAYLLTNINEFFAMTASVALYGHADRPPFTRDNLAQRQPAYAAWLASAVH